jgi:hypothetical protein
MVEMGVVIVVRMSAMILTERIEERRIEKTDVNKASKKSGARKEHWLTLCQWCWEMNKEGTIIAKYRMIHLVARELPTSL